MLKSDKKLYCREIHIARDSEHNLLWDVEGSRLIEINDVEWEVLHEISQKSQSRNQLLSSLPYLYRTDEVDRALLDLLETELLSYSSENLSTRTIRGDIKDEFLRSKSKESLMHIFLNVIQTCNLRCFYCYANEGTYSQSTKYMSTEVAMRAVDFLLKASGEREGCRITFFGGEPLLNFDLIKFTVEYAQKQAKKYSNKVLFSITTNGTLLDDDKIDYLVSHRFDVTVSIDGPQQIHDQNRFFKGKKERGTYNVIYPKLQRLIEKTKMVKCFLCIRATIAREGMRNFCNLLDYFSNFEMNQFAYDFAESRLSGAYADRYPSHDDVEEFAKQLQKARLIIMENLSKGKVPFHLKIFFPYLKAIHTRKKKYRFCATIGSSFAGVSSDGSIFLCHRFVGTNRAKIGDVWNGIARQCLETVKKIHILNSTVCSKCWARYVCGGGCPYNNYELVGDFCLSGTVDPLHCATTKTLFEQAMLLYVELPAVKHALNEELLEKQPLDLINQPITRSK